MTKLRDSLVSRALLPTLLAAALTGGAANAGENEPPTAIAFSGGGYHALSGAAAWMMGIMERTGQYDLGKVTAQADAISANSGGSWFTTLSAFSPSFAGELQQKDAYLKFTQLPTEKSDGGYMGRVWHYISTHQEKWNCNFIKNDVEQAACQLFLATAKDRGFINFLLSGDGQWHQVVENAVFGKESGWPYYGEVETLTLSGKRNAWAEGKPLMLAGTLLTQNPSLSPGKGLLPLNNVQTVGGIPSGSPLTKPIIGGVPVILADGGDPTPAPLAGGSLDLAYGTWSKVDKEWDFQPTDRTALENADLAVAQLRVIDAAAISSAAGGGFIDIPAMKANLSSGAAATVLNGFAPAFQLRDGATGTPVMTFHDNVHKAFVAKAKNSEAASAALANAKVVRFADGGFVDNTGVAQLLRHLQDTNGGTVPKEFSIVAFDNLPAAAGYWDPQNKQGPFHTGGDIAALFGLDQCTDQGCSMQSGGLHHMKLILSYVGQSAQVFRATDYFPTDQGGAPLDRVYWSPSTEEEKIVCEKTTAGVLTKKVEQPLTYSRYPVTVDAGAPGSRLFGISQASDGVTGTLHVFAFLGGQAFVVPNTPKQFACYEKAVKGIVEQVRAKGGSCNTANPRGDGNDCSLGDYLQEVLKL